ncbi:hypothetical protein ACFOGI_09780 [Virgibacillus xinjiangensis]|uniref:Uncharacterized protein n=1 Tax=Virgibacillus xinjiangensis TaxID=393090 RepID=A0ABV7CVQ1_9BACI
MDQKQNKDQENINVQLGGMGVYGNTSNKEIGGYRASGDIENAGRLDKGFQKNAEGDDIVPSASIKEEAERMED